MNFQKYSSFKLFPAENIRVLMNISFSLRLFLACKIPQVRSHLFMHIFFSLSLRVISRIPWILKREKKKYFYMKFDDYTVSWMWYSSSANHVWSSWMVQLWWWFMSGGCASSWHDTWLAPISTYSTARQNQLTLTSIIYCIYATCE